MSESLKHQEALPSPEHEELLPAHASAERHEDHKAEVDPGQLAAEARRSITETAGQHHNALKHLETTEEAPKLHTAARPSRDHQKATLQRELRAIRRKLPRSEQMLSRIVHQPVVRVVSQAAGATISRPSGMLGGGLVALIGTSGYLYLAKHLGFSYNYFVFLALFAAGFVVGLILELLVFLVFTARRRARS